MIISDWSVCKNYSSHGSDALSKTDGSCGCFLITVYLLFYPYQNKVVFMLYFPLMYPISVYLRLETQNVGNMFQLNENLHVCRANAN